MAFCILVMFDSFEASFQSLGQYSSRNLGFSGQGNRKFHILLKNDLTKVYKFGHGPVIEFQGQCKIRFSKFHSVGMICGLIH